MVFAFSPIGLVRSCFTDTFGIPRQPGLVPEAEGSIVLLPPFDRAEAVRGLEQFSHVWILFVFHRVEARTPRATVRPPRLGGNRRTGVFATRSGYRPNPIGMSVVELVHVAPGPVLLPEDYDDARRHKAVARTLLRREGSPRDVANAVLFLLGGTDFATGSVITVDGGRQVL